MNSRQSLLFLGDALLDYTSRSPLGAIGLHFPAYLGGYELETESLLPPGCAAGLHFPASFGGYETM